MNDHLRTETITLGRLDSLIHSRLGTTWAVDTIAKGPARAVIIVSDGPSVWERLDHATDGRPDEAIGWLRKRPMGIDDDRHRNALVDYIAALEEGEREQAARVVELALEVAKLTRDGVA